MNRYYERLKPFYRVDQNKREGPPQVSTPRESDIGVASQNGDQEPFKSNGPPYPQGSLPVDKTLQFESRFESGNLRKVVKVGTFEYELYLKNDYATQSVT